MRRSRSAFTLLELLIVLSIGATLIAVVAPSAVRRLTRGSASAREVARALERAARRASISGRAHVVQLDRSGQLTLLEERSDAKAYGVAEPVPGPAAPAALPAGTTVTRVRIVPDPPARPLVCEIAGPDGRARVVLDPVAARARVELP